MTIADIIETPSTNTKLNALCSVILNMKNGSTKINSDSMEIGNSMLTKTIIARMQYG